MTEYTKQLYPGTNLWTKVSSVTLRQVEKFLESSKVDTLLISRGAILNIKFMTSFA